MKKVSYQQFISYKESSEAEIHYIEDDRSYKLFLANNNFELVCLIFKSDDDAVSFESSYKSSSNVKSKSDVSVTETIPFAKPDYRTKRDATDAWIVCSENTATPIDFYISEERYVSGGEIIFKNAKEGDYITAEVYDKDSVVPEPYQAAVAEDWPTIAKYIPKKWIVPTEVDKYGSFIIDTYPLNAQIPPYFYLRVTYHASAITGERRCAINYHLTKKL